MLKYSTHGVKIQPFSNYNNYSLNYAQNIQHMV